MTFNINFRRTKEMLFNGNYIFHTNLTSITKDQGPLFHEDFFLFAILIKQILFRRRQSEYISISFNIPKGMCMSIYRITQE